ncbi:Zinc finger BED domain-containing protein DAYSLEEPER, partial [Mucuna pruriens]
MLLLVVVVLDPRYKIRYMNWTIDQLFDLDKENELKSRLESSFKSLFDEYNGHKEVTQKDTQQTYVNVSYYKIYPYGHTSRNKSDLQKYAEEELDTSTNLNILDWWKTSINLCRFSILSNIAQQLLVVPVSPVAFEFAFSIRGRVLDSYHGCLSQQKVEALICTQDWLKEIFLPSFGYDFEEFQSFDKGILMFQIYSNKFLVILTKFLLRMLPIQLLFLLKNNEETSLRVTCQTSNLLTAVQLTRNHFEVFSSGGGPSKVGQCSWAVFSPIEPYWIREFMQWIRAKEASRYTNQF